jgi:hypothetical protein
VECAAAWEEVDGLEDGACHSLVSCRVVFSPFSLFSLFFLFSLTHSHSTTFCWLTTTCHSPVSCCVCIFSPLSFLSSLFSRTQLSINDVSLDDETPPPPPPPPLTAHFSFRR